MKLKKFIAISISIFLLSCSNKTDILPNKIENSVTKEEKKDSIPNIIEPTKIEPLKSNSEIKIDNIDKEFKISTSKSNIQTNSNISVNKDGNTMLCWTSYTDSNRVEIYARVYDKDYNPLTEEFKVNTYDIDTINDSPILFSKSNAYVSSDQDGNFIVSWINAEKLHLKILSSLGETIRKEFIPQIDIDNKIIDIYSNDNYSQKLLNLKNGKTFILSNNHLESDYSFINGAFYDKEFNQIGKTMSFNIQLRGSFIGTYDNDKILMLYWSDNLLKGQRFDSNGNIISSEFTILDKSVQNISLRGNSFHLNDDGSFFITYNLTSETAKNLYYSKYSVDNTEVIKKVKINTTDLIRSNGVPNITYLPYINYSRSESGDFIFTWGEESINYSKGNIYFRRYNSYADTSEGDVKVNYFSKGFNGIPNVSINKNRNFIITWSNWNDNDKTFQLYGRKYNLDSKLPIDKPELIPTQKLDCFIENKNDIDESWDNSILIKVKINDEILEIKSKEDYINLIEKYKSIDNKYGISEVKINGVIISSFSIGLDARLKKSLCIDSLKEKYDAYYNIGPYGFYSIRSKNAGNNIQSLIKQEFKNKEIKEIEFSSLTTLFNYYLYLELNQKYKDIFENLNLSYIPTDA